MKHNHFWIANLFKRIFKKCHTYLDNKEGHNQSGNVLDSAMSERMILICGLARHLYPDKPNNGGGCI